MRMPTNDLSIEELLHAVLDTVDEGVSAEPPGRTADCVSLRKLEAHAKNIAFLSTDEMRHVNRCPDYCQANLETARRHLNPDHVVFDVPPLQRLAAHKQGSGAAVY